MYVVSLLAKLAIFLISTNGFVRGLMKDLQIEDASTRRISIAAGITVYVGALVLYYFAGVFEPPKI